MVTKTLRYDQDIKRPLYASRSIPVYWIVNAIEQQVEVYTDPGPDGYATCEVVKPGKSVRVVIDGKEVGQIAVDDFMPEPGARGRRRRGIKKRASGSHSTSECRPDRGELGDQLGGEGRSRPRGVGPADAPDRGHRPEES